MFFKKKLRFFLVIIFFLGYIGNSFSIEPDEFVQLTVDEASQVLSDTYSKEEKMKKLESIAKKTVDIRGLGFYTLGSHRKNLSDEQKKKYLNLFEKYFLKSFSSRLAEYTDPKIRVESVQKLNEKYTIVSSILLATDKRPEVKIGWRVYTKNPEKPLIRDLIIEGLSLARTQKEEFNSIIQSNNGDIKISTIKMRKKLGISKATCSTAIHKLIEVGLIRLTRVGQNKVCHMYKVLFHVVPPKEERWKNYPDKDWKDECPKSPHNLIGKDTRFKSHPKELDRINDNQSKELG